MWTEKKTRTVNPVKPEADTFPLIVVKAKRSVPCVRTVKSKERVKVSTTNRKCLINTGETPGDTMKLCVNLMPLLAAARETMEEEEEEEDSSCKKEKEAETRNKDDPCVTKSEDKTSLSNSGFSLNVSPRLVLPPLTQPAAAPKTKRCHTPLPPIGSSDQTTMSSNSTTKSCPGDVTAERDSRPWINNPLLSQSRPAEFCLPDISLCSLDALLQTVTQKLRRKRRGGDEEPWRRVQSDHLLLAVSDQKSVRQQMECSTENKQPADVDAETGASLNRRRRRLPPLFPTQRPTLILSMTKRNLPTPNPLQ